MINLGRRHSIGYIYIGFNSTFISAVFNFFPPHIATLMSTHLYRPDIIHLYRWPKQGKDSFYIIFLYIFLIVFQLNNTQVCRYKDTNIEIFGNI